MKVTLSAAMRARDVSTPSAEDMARAEGGDQAAGGSRQAAAKAKTDAGGKHRGARPGSGQAVQPPHASEPARDVPRGTGAAAGARGGAAEPRDRSVTDEGGGSEGRRGKRRRSRTRRGQRQ
jgi:hypothetical protein